MAKGKNKDKSDDTPECAACDAGMAILALMNDVHAQWFQNDATMQEILTHALMPDRQAILKKIDEIKNQPQRHAAAFGGCYCQVGANQYQGVTAAQCAAMGGQYICPPP
jgi:hypothetical protein